MRAQIIEHPGTLEGLLSPSLGTALWPPAIHMRFKMLDIPQPATANEFFYSEKIRIPSPVMKYRDHSVYACGKLDEAFTFSHCGDEGFLDDHMLTCFKSLR